MGVTIPKASSFHPPLFDPSKKTAALGFCLESLSLTSLKYEPIENVYSGRWYRTWPLGHCPSLICAMRVLGALVDLDGFKVDSADLYLDACVYVCVCVCMHACICVLGRERR